jgi:xanthine dehydrogenase YagT iron-sulfur-binding subunit
MRRVSLLTQPEREDAMSTSLFSVGPRIGSHAPEIVRTALDGQVPRGEPRVLAFSRDGSFERDAAAAPGALDAIRAQLRGLGAELIVLSPAGAWSLGADDPVEPLPHGADAVDVATAAALYSVGDGEDAVFVIDSRGVVRFVHRSAQRTRPLCAALAEALAVAGRAQHTRDAQGARQRVLFTRREWTVTCLVVGCATTFLASCKEQSHKQAERRPARVDDTPGTVDVTLTINGVAKRLTIDSRASLLDTLRERLGLTGTKKGCDMGQCGACTVLLGGKRVTSCLTLAVMAQGRDITTIEGLAKDGVLHPMQRAFIENDGLQCGYCTPGQIMSAVGLLSEGHAQGAQAMSDAEVREQMSGNICRCGAYPNIIAAIQAARRARG